MAEQAAACQDCPECDKLRAELAALQSTLQQVVIVGSMMLLTLLLD